ncbi:hypothetical protein LSH36_479g00033 [Paralvinella palmiformis]|uniref:UmuC domain-containing protein n=1 Tax=Paralvinella palmiformis TaxID=53620 RepID=A0AAD9MYG4_9ANNE|nr:hypothetical protein LSH36_479g00033 [Paralvinella palmiformis]
MAAKIQKLKDQVKSDEPSVADIKQLILEHVGVFHHYYRRELVTHIIASNLPNSKMANLSDKKVCRPNWITDRAYVNQLQQQGDHSYPSCDKLRELATQRLGKQSDLGGAEYKSKLSLKKTRLHFQDVKLQKLIMHIDMECFFVSIRIRNWPDFTLFQVSPLLLLIQEALAYQRIVQQLTWVMKEPIIKTESINERRTQKTNIQVLVYEDELVDELDDCEHQSGDQFEKGSLLSTEQQAFHSMAEIASCSYEARKAGVHNGMFMGTTKQLCPDVITIPYDFDGYSEVSKMLYDTVAYIYIYIYIYI